MKNKSSLNISNIEIKRNEKMSGTQDFRLSSRGKKLVCVENTKIILNMLEMNIYYDVIKKRAFIESPNNNKYNGDVTDYTAIGIAEYASKQNYFISKNTMIDHLMFLAEDNPVNKVWLFFERARSKWDGISRIENVYNTLNSKMDRKLGLAYFTKWAIQAIRLAGNTDGKMNQEFVFVIQGEQGCGKTTWFKLLFSNLNEYFKEGLELKPDNKDSVLECISNFAVEIGELEGTMKHEQSQIKAFITRSQDEIRKPYERLAKRTPRQTILFGTVNDSEFLKDKTGNRRYAIVQAGEKIDRLDHIDLEQFWGEIATLAHQGKSHLLTDEEKEKQKIENNHFEVLSEVEIAIQTGFHWGADTKYWRKLSTASICQTLNLPTKSKNVSLALKKKGCKSWRSSSDRGWIVPPFLK